MSITEKLARSLRTLMVNDHYNVAHSNDELADAREALAEYDASQSTPAGEVTADAVEVASQALHDSKFQFSHPRMGIKTFLWHEASEEWKANARKEMQATLAAAFPALTQQVERLKAHIKSDSEEDIKAAFERLDLRDKCAALSAENARLAKDAERWHTLVALVHAEEWNGWDVHVPSNLRREADGDLVAAVDAAAAQAKQSPEKIP